MASVTSGSKSGISKKSLYKLAPKKKIKAKHTSRKLLVQGQLIDLNNPRSAKICKNGMKSLLIGTLECNFLSPDVQRRETICTPGKASLSSRQYDSEVDDKLSATMNEKENWNKEDSVAKVICHAQCSAKKKLLGKSPGPTYQKNPHVIVSATEIKSNSSFFNRDANTTLLNDMNTTQFHFDSSDSEEDLNSKKTPKKPMPLEKSISRAKWKGRIKPSYYMQSAQNFVADKTPVKKDPNKSYNVSINRGFAWR